jgi:hypothetical protein
MLTNNLYMKILEIKLMQLIMLINDRFLSKKLVKPLLYDIRDEK